MKIRFDDLSKGLRWMLVIAMIAIPVFIFVNKFPITINYNPPDKTIIAFGADEEDTHYFYEMGGQRFRVRKEASTVKVDGPFRVKLKDGILVIPGFTAIIEPESTTEDLIRIHNNVGEWNQENLRNTLSDLVPLAWNVRAKDYLDVGDIEKKNHHMTYMFGQASDKDNTIYNEVESMLDDIGIDLEAIYMEGMATTIEDDK
jgi:hypothetical protein